MNNRMHDMAILFLRLGFGLSMATHGYAKIFGGWMGKFTEGVAAMGFPAPEVFAWIAALSELVGGILVALGLGTRVSAFFVAFTMVVAAFVQHAADPFAKKELAVLFLVGFSALILTGGGQFALDRFLHKHHPTPK